MKFTIEKTENGFITTDYICEDTSEDGTEIIKEYKNVIETENMDEKEELKKVLFKVADLLGYTYDKWEKENLNITFDKKGHKVE